MKLSNLSKIKPISIEGFFFRAVNKKYKDRILSTKGSEKYGGRYNEPGVSGVLYLSESEEVCKAEIKRKDPHLLQPYVIGKIKVKLNKVLDLTSEENLKELGLKKEELIKEESEGGYKITRKIAREAFKLKFEALLVPSITGKGNNLVVLLLNIPDSRKPKLNEIHRV